MIFTELEMASFVSLSLLEEHKYEEVIEVAQPALDKYPDTEELLYALALAYPQTRAFDQAHKCAHQLVENWPDNAGYYRLLGLSFMYLKQYSEAIKPLSQAIQLDPESAYSYEVLASAYELNRQYDLCFTNITKAIEISKERGEPEIDDHRIEIRDRCEAKLRLGNRSLLDWDSLLENDSQNLDLLFEYCMYCVIDLKRHDLVRPAVSRYLQAGGNKAALEARIALLFM